MTERKPRLRLRLTPAAENAVRAGHPWVFADRIREQNRAGEAGELAVVYDRRDRFLALGLFDPESNLRVRVLQSGRPVAIDDAWWRARLDTALARRASVLDEETTACRLINGESDGWPGLVLDRYERVLVLKLYTAAWRPYLANVVPLLRDTLQPEGLVLRLSRNVQATFAKADYHDGQILSGAALESPVVFLESGLRFEADVMSGQKTGFFLDQRENRRLVEGLARGAEVLNAFSFSGGFSLYAARGGACSVASLDISPRALESARRNFALNAGDAAVSRCRQELIQADAFQWLERKPARFFDLIVLDPPSLARRETERARAIGAYEKLAAAAMRHLRPRGTLVAASCSAHVSREEFFAAVQSAARKSRRNFDVLRTTGHAPDHPATFPEAEYLKCIYVRCRA